MWMALVASSFLAFLSAFLAFPTLRRVQRARQQQARCSAQRCDAGQRRKNRSISLVTPKSDLSPPSLAPSCLHPPLPVWVLYLQWRDLRLRAGPAQVPQYPGRRYTGTSYHTPGPVPQNRTSLFPSRLRPPHKVHRSLLRGGCTPVRRTRTATAVRAQLHQSPTVHKSVLTPNHQNTPTIPGRVPTTPAVPKIPTTAHATPRTHHTHTRVASHTHYRSHSPRRPPSLVQV